MSICITAAPSNFGCSDTGQVIDFICTYLLQDSNHELYGSVSDAVNGWFAAQRRVLGYLRYSWQHHHTSKQEKRRICFIQADTAMQMQHQHNQQLTPPPRGWNWSQVKQILYEVLPVFAKEMADDKLQQRLPVADHLNREQEKWLLLSSTSESENYRCEQLRRWLLDFLFARIKAWPLLTDVVYFMQLQKSDDLREVLFTQLTERDMELIISCLREVSLNRLIDMHESGIEQPLSPSAQSLLNAVMVSAFPLTCYDITPESTAEDFHTSVIKHYFPSVVLQVRRRIRTHIGKYCAGADLNFLKDQQQQLDATDAVVIKANDHGDCKRLGDRLEGCSRLLVCNADRCDVVMFVAVKTNERWSLEPYGVNFSSASGLASCLSSSIDLVGHSIVRLLFL